MVYDTKCRAAQMRGGGVWTGWLEGEAVLGGDGAGEGA